MLAVSRQLFFRRAKSDGRRAKTCLSVSATSNLQIIADSFFFRRANSEQRRAKTCLSVLVTSSLQLTASPPDYRLRTIVHSVFSSGGPAASPPQTSSLALRALGCPVSASPPIHKVHNFSRGIRNTVYGIRKKGCVPFSETTRKAGPPLRFFLKKSLICDFKCL